jgi:Mg/Co/Ni transporter MgtE
MSEPDTPVSELIQREVITVNPDDDQELVAETMSKYDLLALPVIDETGILLGIVTVDDALDVLEEESAEDLAIATGAAAEHGRTAGWWWWLVRRNAWLLVWTVAFLAYISLRSPLTRLVADGDSAARAGTLLMGWAVVILPLLLRTAEDLSSRTLAELIEGDAGEERPSLGARLLREGGIGLVTAALSALVAFGLAFLLLGGVDPAAAPFALSTAAAALITALAGGVLGHLAIQRSATGKTVSGTGLSVVTMLLSAVVYLTLAYAAGSLGSVPGSGA